MTWSTITAHVTVNGERLGQKPPRETTRARQPLKSSALSASRSTTRKPPAPSLSICQST